MLQVHSIPVTSFQQNSYVLSIPHEDQAVIIDPGGDAEKILGFCKKENLEVGQVWLTHSHLDHCGGTADIISSTEAKLFGHEAEALFRSNVEEIAAAYGLQGDGLKNCPEPDSLLVEGMKVSVGAVEFTVIFAPGHSPGHVCFYSKQEEVLFAGDVLFAGSIGRTDLPGGDPAVLMQSLKEKIVVLPPQTKVYSGHGPATTIGQELETNPFLQGVK